MCQSTSKILNTIARWVFVLAIAGWFAPLVVACLPPKLFDNVEFPNSLGSDRVLAPDGRVFIASEPFSRVQLYGPHGFERGFQIPTAGGVFNVAISAQGNLLVCAARTKVLVTYSPNGTEIGARQPCVYDPSIHTPFPGTFSVVPVPIPAIAFNWFSALAVPLWHPFAAWLLGAGSIWFRKTYRARLVESDVRNLSQ